MNKSSNFLIKCFCFCLISLNLFHCDSLLFPSSKPLYVDTKLSTPDAVITQLQKAYTHRDPKLLDTIFCNPRDSFRFLIPGESSADYANIQNKSSGSQHFVSQTTYLTSGSYTPMTYGEETEVLTGIQEKTTDLTFTTPLTIYLDSVYFDTTLNDTVALVITDPATISITAAASAGDILTAFGGLNTYAFNTGKQIFIMQRKPDRTWGIRFWFELQS